VGYIGHYYVSIYGFKFMPKLSLLSASDLDLVILAKNEQPIDIEQFVRFKERLINSNIPILIQVMDWNRMPISFRDNILSNYVELMG